MPYNKGDFTQQGINGDVSALVRLNEKRVMKVVLSSDDESDNCDISGKVYDLLNGTSYDVGSGVSGNIEITENGENINVAPYATATVNVSGGGGDNVLYCTVTLVPDADAEITTDEGTFAIENSHICVAENQYDSETVLLCPYYEQPAPIPELPPVNYVPLYLASGAVVTASNAVNCIYDDGEIIVTDWSLASSITLSGYSPK